ncbi:hypothetical protein [Singulisphaera acidiphila]|uniref:Uncharacterized protein n=1 Tax=Singulisphaera acidiphila (strain ATCC BAA-1392 / DSM 18658 / VKM B-2454 / MOB10) TaxID=886293 RepID=L0DFZ3_SINAD|nr:hypothetical protein [Singulisphaera acidiphila]AGA27738.1 hypothetical protein Sinac_3481 [Singulisphaera acidiphila DSM 18658]
MKSSVIRLVPMIGVTFAVCMPAFVFAQIRMERVELAPAKAVVSGKKEIPVVAPARAPGQVQLAAPVIIFNKDLNIGGDLNGVVLQWTRQFRPILQVEYLFMRVICDPSKEERLSIACAGLKALDEAAKTYTDWQKNHNMVVGGKLVERPATPDTRKFIQDALAVAVKAKLSPSQYERYRVELDARSAEQKRAAILSLIVRLDLSLVLSAEQREQIRGSLSSHWDEAWTQGLQSLNLENQYIPMIPDPLVVKYLNANQTTIWTGLQKVTINASGLGFGLNIQGADQPLDDEFSDEVAAAKKDPEPEPKK